MKMKKEQEQIVDTELEELKAKANAFLDLHIPSRRAGLVKEKLTKFQNVEFPSPGFVEVLDAAEEMMNLLAQMKLLEEFKLHSRALHDRCGEPDWRKDK